MPLTVVYCRFVCIASSVFMVRSALEAFAIIDVKNVQEKNENR